MLRRWAGAAAGAVLLAGAVPGAARADQYREMEQPFLAALQVPQAWRISQGAGVTVAVLDSGVDGAVQDLAGQVTTGPDYAAGADPAGVAAKRLHGTNMASLIAGHGHGPGDTEGVVGVAPKAHILSVRVLLEKDEAGFSTYSTSAKYDDTIPRGIRYATDRGAKVINLSLGRRQPSAQERQAIGYAVAKGVVVVASAGNDGTTQTSGSAQYSYPASYPGVISVAAVDEQHDRASFSDSNGGVTISAPGVDVIGAGPGNTYWHGDGTSPAAAFVSGVAALIRSAYPALAPGLVAQAITQGAAARPSGGYSDEVGFGEVSAAGALRAARDLAGYRMSGGGLATGQHFTFDTPAPVEIIHHDRELLAVAAGTGTVGLLGLVGLIAGWTVRRRIRW